MLFIYQNNTVGHSQKYFQNRTDHRLVVTLTRHQPTRVTLRP